MPWREIREKVIAAGMVDHIAKPIDVDDMLETIARWITPAFPTSATCPTADPAPARDEAGFRHDAPFDMEGLRGLDTAAGLIVTMNDHALYRNLLLRFRASEADFANAFSLARQGDDPAAPTRLAHTLRGTAGNIGARDVQATAAMLEQACAEAVSPEVIDWLLSKTLAALDPVIDGLASLRPEIIQSAAQDLVSPGDADIETVRALLARLEVLLEDSNLEAVDVVAELVAAVAGTALAGLVGDVNRAVSRFDTDAALHALREMAERMESE